MSLKPGDHAPDFELPSTAGGFKLSQDTAKNGCILYFYPKNFTPACTAEACAFRDTFDFFKQLNVPVYGISRETLASHRVFKEKYDLPFDLLSDLQAQTARLYKCLIPIANIPQRVTYLIDRRQTIAGVYKNMFSEKKHIKKMIEILKNTTHFSE